MLKKLEYYYNEDGEKIDIIDEKRKAFQEI